MQEAWKKHKAFVVHLDEQKFYEKQGYLEQALLIGEGSPMPTAEPDSMLVSSTSDIPPEEAKAPDSPKRASIPKRVEAAAEVPVSFEQAVAAAMLRCQLLLALEPAKHLEDSRLSVAPPSSQLVQKWGQLLSPPTLVPLLARWSSVGGTVETELKSVPVPASLPADTAGPLFRNCLLYVTRAANASPRLLLAIFRRRIMRAAVRVFGFKALLAVLKCTSFSSCQRESLMHLRPALRGQTAWLTSNKKESGTARTSPDASNIRHHYAKALEGIDVHALNTVQASFIELFVHLGELFSQSVAVGDVAGSHVLAWNWAVDFESVDHEFMLRVGIVPSLVNTFSLAQQAARAQSSLRSRPSADATPADWQPWPIDYVRQALACGTLAKWELVMHMQARGSVPARAGEAAGDWWQANSLHRSARTVALQQTVPSLIDLYSEYVARVALEPSPVVAAASTIQAAFRSYFVRNVLLRQDSADVALPASP